MEIPLFATSPALDDLKPAIKDRVSSVIDGGRYILGPEVERFEEAFASYLGVDHCVGVGNGTDALTIALRAMGLEPGSEVVVPAVTFYATPEAVVDAGLVPVFCDVDPDTHVMTAATAEPVIGPRTAALLPVHLFGNPAPMAELAALAERHGLGILEDAAQAAGARYRGARAGGLGNAATFSFFPSKNLGGIGDGGAIVTSDREIADRARRLRFHGSLDKVRHDEVGYNSRLDAVQAVAVGVGLEHLPEWTRARREAAAAYLDAGIAEAVRPQRETEGGESCYHLYVVRTPERDTLRERLAERGIGARAYYTIPMHRQPAMAPYAPGAPLEQADALCAESLALPMGQSLGRDRAAAVAEAVRELV